MSFNPLNIPWGKKDPEPPKPPEKKVPSYLGLKNEAVKAAAGAEEVVTIKVGGLKGVPSGEYRLEWQEGARLKSYLSRLNLVHSALYSAVHDQTNLEVGRIKMTYVPSSGAIITIGSAGLSTVVHLQRSNHNAEHVALRMGGGAEEVEVPLRRK